MKKVCLIGIDKDSSEPNREILKKFEIADAHSLPTLTTRRVVL